MQSRTVAVAFSCLAGAILSAQAPDYAIKMHRASVVGQTYQLVASASQEQNAETSMDGQSGPAQNMAGTVELTAHVTTLAISKVGRETRVSLVIDQSKCAMDGVTSEILPAKTTVVAERGGNPTYTVRDAAVDPRAARCLQEVFPFSAATDVTDDDIFGTASRQKVGGSWPVNSALAASDLFSSPGMKVDAAGITGSTRLAEIVTLGGQPAMRLSGEMTLKNVSIPLPPGVSVTSSEFKAAMSAIVPVDTGRRDGTSTMTMTGRIECAGDANGHSLRMHLGLTRRLESTVTIQ